jgi:hypothetical protein
MNRVSRSLCIAAAAVLALGAAAALAAHTPAGALRSAKRATVTPPSKDPLVPGWLCRAQRDAMGASFNELWAGNPRAPQSAMGKCVTSMAKANAEGRASQVERGVLAAYQTCKRMRKANAAAFRKRFGATTGTSNALGKCVRARTSVFARGRAASA